MKEKWRNLGTLDIGNTHYDVFAVWDVPNDKELRRFARRMLSPPEDKDYPKEESLDKVRRQVKELACSKYRGRCLYWCRLIIVLAGMDKMRFLETLAHECAHAILDESIIQTEWDSEKQEWAAELLGRCLIPIVSHLFLPAAASTFTE